MELANSALGVVDMTSEEAFAEILRGLKKPYPSIEELERDFEAIRMQIVDALEPAPQWIRWIMRKCWPTIFSVR